MNKIPKGQWIDQTNGIIECPHCGKRVAIKVQSNRLENGKLRERYINTIVCPDCTNPYKIY